ncbi:hypothetical protein L7F22_067744, partial [Adiantum nelumboides]|nr:hypothetical protein [Adiantum nelumboides]
LEEEGEPVPLKSQVASEGIPGSVEWREVEAPNHWQGLCGDPFGSPPKGVGKSRQSPCTAVNRSLSKYAGNGTKSFHANMQNKA